MQWCLECEDVILVLGRSFQRPRRGTKMKALKLSHGTGKAMNGAHYCIQFHIEVSRSPILGWMRPFTARAGSGFERRPVRVVLLTHVT